MRSPLRICARGFCRWLLSRTGRPCGREDLQLPAVVFSPHFDDETLACGGTILKKKAAGADVKIVFMTDGSRSHRNLMPADQLSKLRMQEGVAASIALGLRKDDVYLLKLEEGKVGKQQDAAVAGAFDLLSKHKPAEIYIPCGRDVHPDHVATNRAVLAAVRQCGLDVVVNEYPVWFWRQWPWVGVRVNMRRQTREIWKTSFRSRCGLQLVRDFRHLVCIRDVLDRKRAALNRHRSQMTRLAQGWAILRDMDQGDFLDCFFQDHEVFRRYRVAGGQMVDSLGAVQ